MGANTYGVISLLITLPYLLPFADLGLGAALTNTAGDAEGNRGLLMRAWKYTAVRLATLSAVAIALLAVGAINGWWAPLLGLTGVEDVNAAAFYAFGLFFVSVPLALGSRILVGLEKAEWAVGLQAIGAPASLLLVWCSLQAGSNLAIVTGASMAGYTATTLAGTLIAMVASRSLKENADSAKRFSPRSAKRQAMWMVIISVAIPVTFQSDKLLLSLRGNASDLAIYAVLSLLFSPGISVIQAAELSLWGYYANRRTHSHQRSDFQRLVLTIGLVAGAMGAMLVGIGPWIGNWIVHESWFGWSDFTWPSLFLIAMALHSPGHMFSTDERGLRFQSFAYTFMAVCSLALTWVFIPQLGAQAPVMGSAIGLFFFLFLPVSIRAYYLMERSPAWVQSSVANDEKEPANQSAGK